MTQDDHKPDYIIKKRRSSQWYWAWGLAIFSVLAAAVAFGYWLNLKRYDFSETAEQQFQQVQVSLKEANASATRWQQQYQVEKDINQQLREHTLNLELKVNSLNKEVQAYQRIFDPDSVESGLQIASFAWEQAAQQQYNYRLVLIQAKQQNANISGSYEISLVGEEAGETKEINFNELESLTSKDRKFRFKYMEARNGNFVLPKDFQPKFIRVIVTSTGKNGKSISADYSWKTAQPDNDQQQEPVSSNEQTGGSGS